MGKNKYDRRTAISKLIAKGCKPKPDIQKISYFLIPFRVHLGLKMLGILDFLKINIERPKQKVRKLGEQPKPRPPRDNTKIIGKCMICQKEVLNTTGFFRLTSRNQIIKIHNGECKRKANLLIDEGLTLEELGGIK